MVPGDRSYASTAKYGRNVIVFGDSKEVVGTSLEIGRMKRKLFSNSLSTCRSSLKYFSGTRTKYFEYYVTPTLISAPKQMLLSYT